MIKISRLILSAFCLLTFTVNAFSYTPLTRIRNFVNDAANNVPITASYMDAELNQDITALNATMVVQSTSPSSPFEGMTWYNTTLHVIEEYRNNEWVIIGAVHVASSAMANPQQGDLWFNTSTNTLNTYNGSSFISLVKTDSNGNVGIGTTLSTNALDIATGGVSIGTTYAGYKTAPSNGLIIQGNVGFGTFLPGESLDIEGGNVGIGTVTAGNSLVVNGSIQPINLLLAGTNIVTCTGNPGCTATCGAGYYITGGGCQFNAGATFLNNYPSSSTAWTCTNSGADAATGYAICARIQ